MLAQAKLRVQVPVNVGRNYNGPKVDTPRVQRGPAPQRGDVLKCSWLYAGNTVYLPVLGSHVTPPF